MSSEDKAISRRAFIQTAVAFAAAPAWATPETKPSTLIWREVREVFSEGVASGDPDSTSVFLWTRRPSSSGRERELLRVEVAEDAMFRRVVATARANVLREADWTCRVLVGGLRPSTVYWYRFIDADGHGSRLGRTKTAPLDRDDHLTRFAFVSCQNANQGAQNAYRRMIFDDERSCGRAARLRAPPWRLHL